MGHATTVLELGGVRIATDPLLRTSLGPLERHGAPPGGALVRGRRRGPRVARPSRPLRPVVARSHLRPSRRRHRPAGARPGGGSRGGRRGRRGRRRRAVRDRPGRGRGRAGPPLDHAGDAAGAAGRVPPPGARLAVGLLRRRHGLVPGAGPARRPRRPRPAAGLDVGAAPRARASRAAIGGGGPRAARCGRRRADPLGDALPAPPVARLGPAAPPAGRAVRGPRLAPRARGRRPRAPAGGERRVRHACRRSRAAAAVPLGGRLDR